MGLKPAAGRHSLNSHDVLTGLPPLPGMRRWWSISLVVLGLMLALVLGYFLSVVRLERLRGMPAGGIETYGTVLIRHGKAAPFELERSTDDKAIDELIVNRYLGKMSVREMSRSKIYYELPLRNSAFVKIYLHTALPETKRGSRINILIELDRRGGTWIVRDESTLKI